MILEKSKQNGKGRIVDEKNVVEAGDTQKQRERERYTYMVGERLDESGTERNTSELK